MIGVDVDGVLADFTNGYIRECVKHCGVDRFPPRPFDLPTWHFPQHYGYTQEEVDRVWDRIRGDAYFWMSLDPYPDTRVSLLRLDQLFDDHDIMFITNREGVFARRQTCAWLAAHGFAWPTVMIAKHVEDKVELVRQYALDVYIDDRWETAVGVAQTPTRSYLLSREWNLRAADRTGDTAALGIIEVTSMKAFLDDVIVYAA